MTIQKCKFENHNKINIYIFPSDGLNFCTLHFDLHTIKIFNYVYAKNYLQ